MQSKEPESAAPEGDSKQVRAAVRALQVIEAVAAAREMKHAAIAQSLDIPKSTTTLILDTLVQRGYLKKDENTRAFSLGSRILGIAGRYLAEMDVVRLSQPVMARLVLALDESCFLVQAEGDAAVVLWRETCQHRLAYTLSLGERVGLAETAGGLSLLAWRDPSNWEPTLRAGGVTDAEAIADTVRQLRAIRGGAVAVCVNGHVREVSSLAVPLLNSLGECVAALSVAIPSSRLDPAKQAAIEEALQAARGQVFR